MNTNNEDLKKLFKDYQESLKPFNWGGPEPATYEDAMEALADARRKIVGLQRQMYELESRTPYAPYPTAPPYGPPIWCGMPAFPNETGTPPAVPC